MKHLILVVLFLFPLQVDADVAVRVRRQITTKQVKVTKSPVVDSRNAVLKSTPRSDSTDLSAHGVRVYTWEDIQPIIARKARKAGIHPAVAVGQAANESEHGRATLATEHNNYFGIKGSGNAGTVEMWTSECAKKVVDGKEVKYCYRTKANFAVFKTPEDSMDEYIKIARRMLKGCGSSEPKGQLACIWHAGYATSLAYLDHVSSVEEFKNYDY